LDPTSIEVDEIIPIFTFSLFQNVSRSLLEKDKLLFLVMLAAKLRQFRGELDPDFFNAMVSSDG
jgi:hypothetical protein